jgi:hypothetical protein
MGNDQSGKFQPVESSSLNKEEDVEIQANESDQIKQYVDVTDKYTDEDEQAQAAPIRHRNRNTSKRGSQYKGKDQKEESGKVRKETSTEELPNTVAEEIPGRLTKEIFAELAAYKSSCSISLFLPTRQAGTAAGEGADINNFRNTLQDVEKSLREKDISPSAIEFMLKPGYELLTDDSFWTGLSKGLAIFIADGYFKYIKLPVSPDQKVVCEPSFYVSPLVPIISTSEYFYLLVISKSQVKLFRADAFGMEHVQVGDLPEGGIGTGGAVSDDKTSIANYFEIVDDILFKKVFNRENAPLVLAGVEYLIPIYKSVCDYHHVWSEFLTGSYEYENTSVLYEQVMKLMQPYFEERKQKALNQYGNKSATELTSSALGDVISASYYGRISHLFVLKGAHVWGIFDEMNTTLDFHASANDGGDDLIDNAVEKTLLTGGEVFILGKEEMPADSEIAAIFRY